MTAPSLLRREGGWGSIPGSIVWLGAATVGLVTMAIGAKLWMESGLSWQCPALALFGLPCPSCGSTRALAALVEFDLLRALRFNPLVIVGIGFLLIAPLLKFQTGKWGNLGWAIFAAAVSLNWVYLMLFLPR